MGGERVSVAGRDEALAVQLHEAHRHLDVQLASYRAVEQKAVDVVKLGALVLALVMSGVGVVARLQPAPDLPRWSETTIVAGLGAIVASTALAAFSSVSVRFGSGIRGFRASAADADSSVEGTYAFLLDVYEEMLERNTLSVERKLKSVDYAIFGFLFGIASLGTTAIVLITDVI